MSRATRSLAATPRRSITATSVRLLHRELTGEGLITKVVLVAFLVAVSYVFLFPLLKMVSMSLMSQADLINPEVEWIP